MRFTDIPVIPSSDVPDDRIFFFPGRMEFQVPAAMSLEHATYIVQYLDLARMQDGLQQYGYDLIEDDRVPEWLRVSEGL